MSALIDLRTPCDHNTWDNLRMRRDLATLSCRVCGAVFKKHRLREVACVEFLVTGECPLGPSCPYLHVYRSRKACKARAAPIDEPHRDNVLHTVALAVIRERSALINDRVWCSTIADEVYARVNELRSTQHYACPVLMSYIDCAGDDLIAGNDSSAASFSEGLSSVRSTAATSMGSAEPSILPSPTDIGPSSALSFAQRQPATLSPSLLPVTEHFVPIQRAMTMSKRCIDENE